MDALLRQAGPLVYGGPVPYVPRRNAMSFLSIHWPDGEIKILPDGFVMSPLYLPPNDGGAPTTTTPIGKSSPTSQTLQALAVVYQAKDGLPDRLRPAAEDFIQAALHHLSGEFGDGGTIIAQIGS
jgi:hypothetical protein